MNIGIDLTVLDSDTFIASYPRSGNTWMRFLVGTLVFETKMDWENIEKYVPAMYAHSDQELLNAPFPRFIKTHHPFDLRFPRAIYLIRDVRDVVISYYNWHLKMQKNFNESFSSFFSKFVNGNLNDNYGSWAENVKSWLENEDELENGCMIVKYEDLNRNTEGQVRELVNFLGLDKSDKEIKETVKWCSFENMKALEKKQQTNVRRFKSSNKNKSFIRKGISGQWEEELTQSQKRIIRDKFGDLLDRLGYTS